MKRHKWTSYTGQAQRAHYSDHEDWRPTFEEAARLTRRSATADCDLIRSLVFKYEEALKEGKSQREACVRVENTMLKAIDMGICLKDNHIILAQAMEAGEVARKAMNPLLGDPNEYETRILAVGIHAAQEMIKANPVALDLPFIRDVMTYILREQKYGEKPVDARDAWSGFLHTRPKKKRLDSPEALTRLVKMAAKEGKPVDAYATAGKALGVSESYLKKASVVKGRGPGRSKKSK